MPRYRFKVPIRAIGGYRLPDVELEFDGIKISARDNASYSARVEVEAHDAEQGYGAAQVRVEELLSYLALWGDDAAFILDGREDAGGLNLDLAEVPVPEDVPPPPFESVWGRITEEGQPYFAAMLDPDGNRRRKGQNIAFHILAATQIPGRERVSDVGQFFTQREAAPPRIRTAVGIIHDAACAREEANAYVQTYTALEALTSHLSQKNLLDVVFARQESSPGPNMTKGDMLAALGQVLASAGFSNTERERAISRVCDANAASRVDLYGAYLADLGIEVETRRIRGWTKLRGSLVHGADVDVCERVEMKAFREVVRRALIEELRRITGQTWSGLFRLWPRLVCGRGFFRSVACLTAALRHT